MGAADEKRERARQEAVAWVHTSTARIIEDVLRKSDDNGIGPLGYLASLAGQLDDMASTLEADGAACRRDREALTALRATYERLLLSAEEKSSFEEAEVGHE